MMRLETPLISVVGIGQRFNQQFKQLGIKTVKDLLWHFPLKYNDFSEVLSIAELTKLPIKSEATIQATVKSINSRRTWKSHLTIQEVTVQDETGSIEATWFNQPYITNTLKPGMRVSLSGKTTLNGKKLVLASPTYEVRHGDEEEAETIHTGRLVPVYPETRGLTSKGLRYYISRFLHGDLGLEEILPPEILTRYGLPDIRQALQTIHFPETQDQAEAAKRRFTFEDLYLLQIHNLLQRIAIARQETVSVPKNLELVKNLLAKLPFELTHTQKAALWEILQDIEKKHPMNRLLQGDVGSGKTIVALMAALTVAEFGGQSAIMAPTEILARQHYETFKRFFVFFDKGAALITGSESFMHYGDNLETETSKKAIHKEIADNRVKIVFGTHALIQKNVNFKSLIYTVVDEQHRFGVKQRAALLQKNDKQTAMHIPHFLSMSATPIPRTLSMTLFGDLDVSLITESPQNRKKVVTKIVTDASRMKMYEFVRNEVKNGRQAFFVCPRIDPEEVNETEGIMWSTRQNLFDIKEIQKREMASVKKEYEKLSKRVFPDLKVEVLHGKLKPKEKEVIMREFLENKTQILVATSVIEVGVDVPNATIMVIESADRFGLAQLHQFRGRVGRGEHQSYCFLMTQEDAASSSRRLKAVQTAKNGFELAEQDLKIRGPGEFLGDNQSGRPDLVMKALKHPELVKESRQAAVETLKNDAHLKNYAPLRKRLRMFQSEVHWE